MSNQIDTADVQKYVAGITHLSQQKGSRLRRSVLFEPGEGEYALFDRVGAVSAVKLNSRHADTPQINTPHDRRRVSYQPYVYADLIDWQDVDRVRKALEGPYMEAGVNAMGRAMDDELIDNALASAYTGKLGSTAVTFANDGGNTVAVNYVESGAPVASNLTIGKLRRARSLIEAGEAHEPGEPLYIWVTQSQIDALLRTTEVTSSDYNVVKALVQGEVNTFLGFEFIRSERLNTDTSTYRQVVAFAKGGMLLSVNREIEVQIERRADKNYTTQVYVRMHIGATRMEGAKVVEIKCSES